MIKVYGSLLCSNTRDFRYNLDYHHISYEFVDINESLKNLKEFLKYRDNEKCFNRVKKTGGIGIPLIILDDGKAVLRWQDYLVNIGYDEVLHIAEECIDSSC